MKTVEQFVEDAKTNVELQEKLKGAVESKEAMNAAIKEAGYDATVDDIAAFVQNKTADLSDDEVEALAGGSEDWEDDVASAMGCVFVACGCICWM